MARIYKKVLPFQDYTAHVYQAIGDKPMTDNEGNFAGYPTANMSVAITPPKEEVNSDFNETSELFHNTPQKAEVYNAFTHSKMRHIIPIMGALAHQEHGMLTAGGSLSPYSSEIVKNAQEKGLPVKSSVHNPTALATNDYTFNDKGFTSHSGQPDFATASQYTPQQIRSAKMHYKQLRGHSSAKSTSPQFEQLQLPGMEK